MLMTVSDLSLTTCQVYTPLAPRGPFGNVKSSIEGALTLGVWTRAGLRTYELAFVAWMGVKSKFRWHSVMSVQEQTVLNGRFKWTPAPLEGMAIE